MVGRMWRQEVDAVRHYGSLFLLTNHPFLTGRPSRARALDDLIAYIKSAGDVPIMTALELATHLEGRELPVRTHEPPDVEPDVFPHSGRGG